MRGIPLLVALIALSAAPARGETSWLESSWQSTKSFAVKASDKVGAFTAAQGARISAASHRALKWAQQKAMDAVPAGSQRSYGLQLPATLDEERPLVLLIHGLDSGSEYFRDLAPLLQREGYQLAAFDYPNDQSIAHSAKLLTGELNALQADHPGLQIDVIAHSMGGLVARSYVEGPDYAGGIDRLILLAPPNHGSSYSRWDCCSEMAEHFMLWKDDPRWHWSWPFVDGVGEAGDDMREGSEFLAALNSQPRRKGVRYTVVAGNRSCGWRYAATSVRFAARCVPDFSISADDAVRDQLSAWAIVLHERPCDHDGLVTVESARLEGVDDFVIAPADHTTIACSRDGLPPVAWPVIKDRLARP